MHCLQEARRSMEAAAAAPAVRHANLTSACIIMQDNGCCQSRTVYANTSSSDDLSDPRVASGRPGSHGGSRANCTPCECIRHDCMRGNRCCQWRTSCANSTALSSMSMQSQWQLQAGGYACRLYRCNACWHGPQRGHSEGATDALCAGMCRHRSEA